MDEKGETDKGVPPPYPLAMVICDGIHRDPGTGKAFLLGCFSVINARTFPATRPLMCLYVAMTEGRGKVPIKIVLVDADEEREEVWIDEKDVDFEDPRTVVEGTYVLDNITFPEPGEYRFQLFASNEFLMERRTIVINVGEQDE